MFRRERFCKALRRKYSTLLHCTLLLYHREEEMAKYTAQISMWISSIRKLDATTMTDTYAYALPAHFSSLKQHVRLEVEESVVGGIPGRAKVSRTKSVRCDRPLMSPLETRTDKTSAHRLSPSRANQNDNKATTAATRSTARRRLSSSCTSINCTPVCSLVPRLVEGLLCYYRPVDKRRFRVKVD